MVIADFPYPVRTKGGIFESIMSSVTDRTKFALIDHVPSRTGIIFPVEELVVALGAKGIDTLVDGAHVPGMIPSISPRSMPLIMSETITNGYVPLVG